MSLEQSPYQNQPLVNDPKAEQYVIGSLLVDPTAYTLVSQYLDEDCFYDPMCRDIWKAVDNMGKQGMPIDVISVSAELSKQKSNVTALDLMNISAQIASSAHVEYHAIRLQDLGRRRKLWVVGQQLSKVGLSEEILTADAHQEAIESIGGVFEKADGVFTLNDAMNSLNEIMVKNATVGGVTTGTKTGMERFDEKGGLQKSDLIIVAGETSQGKTSLALCMTRHAIENGAKVAFYSMEMTKEQLTARLLSAKTNIPANNILYSGSLAPSEIRMIDDARGKLPGENLFFDDKSTSNIDSILLSIRMLKMQKDIDGAVVDYLQILNVNSRSTSFSREQAMGDAARRFKNLAKELNIWIIALSQLSRDSNCPEPNLNRLRDSGQIGEAADVVILVYRAEYYNRAYPAPFDNKDDYPTDGTAMIDVAKGRNIGTFKFFMGFNKNTTNFFKTNLINEDVQVPFEKPEEADAPF
ncbi:replicative DNA helicase [Segatella copri]|jgi:replicative DNA helicase|uniref:DNA 5'-3' helicase n=1 Tax=Segatella copri TaxID=165179 RepID=A0AA90UPJ3_9BACT|nr:DnaB-like helicase C-terminal domain-containing protein [Segatella copri]DAV93555.1 MAG TPA: DnaB-like replicative helicase [Caudoviricetes sp.]MBW0045119.1 replicative DNA helicase [Segatella copri]MCW4079551.1 replicative DNA helicase [Segatella copri]MCW4104446.1 replicative DNA helicase [Segatella copri]MQN69799.1 DNA helicase [Segatella copri]